MTTRARLAALLTATALALLVILPSAVADAGGCKHNPKKCEPTPMPTATVEPTPSTTPEVTPTPTPTVEPTPTQPPEEPRDSCFDHPTDPCTEPTPVPSATATPSAPPSAATPTPVVPSATVTPTATPSPKPPVQLPPTGMLPGPPDTGSAGLRAQITSDGQAVYKPTAQTCYFVKRSIPKIGGGWYDSWTLVCKSAGGWLN